MRLKAAARYFDDTPVYDGYTGAFLWMCQFSSFNDANAVGSTSTRRILSIAPGLALPARRVLRIFDDWWLVGDGNPDSWKGDQIRQSFNMKKSNARTVVLTPAQACLAATGSTVYAQAIYFKDSINSLNNADYDPFWNFFFAPGEAVGKGSFLRDSTGKLFRVRSSYVPLEDLRICQSDEVDIGPVTAVFATGAYDPVLDTAAAGSVTTSVLLMDFTKAYSYLTQASERVAAGDMNALVAASALTPEPGRTVAIAGTTWRILSKDVEGDAWLLHLRRA
jgi:hypothetical protein